MDGGWNRFTSDEAGATEVIGVVLLVAVTVVLASTAAPALMSYTDTMTTYPSATFAFDQSDCEKTELRVTHVAGDAVDASNLYLRSPDVHLSGSWADPHGYAVHGAGDGTIAAGDAAVICAKGLDDATVRVVWESEKGKSVVLATWRAS